MTRMRPWRSSSSSVEKSLRLVVDRANVEEADKIARNRVRSRSSVVGSMLMTRFGLGGDDIFNHFADVVRNLLDTEIGEDDFVCDCRKIGIGGVGQIDRGSGNLVRQTKMTGDFTSRGDAVRRDIETLEGPIRAAEVKGKKIVAVAGSEFDDLLGVAAMTRDQIAQRARAILIVLLSRDPQNPIVDLSQTLGSDPAASRKSAKILGAKPDLPVKAPFANADRLYSAFTWSRGTFNPAQRPGDRYFWRHRWHRQPPGPCSDAGESDPRISSAPVVFIPSILSAFSQLPLGARPMR